MPRKPGRRGWGEGSIRELASGKFVARLPGPGRPSKVFASMSAAREWLREHLARRDKGGSTAAGGQTLREWYEVWITGKRQSTEDMTAEKYAQHFRLHILPGLGDTRLRQLTPDGVRHWLGSLERGEVSRAMRKKVLTTLGVCLNSAVKGNKLAGNPLDGIERPTHKPPEVEVYGPDECRLLLAALAADPWGPLFRLLLDSGCRPGEAIALTWADLDLAAGRVRFNKSLQQRQAGGRVQFKVKATKTPAGNRQVRISADTASSLSAHRLTRPGAERDGRAAVFAADGGGWVPARTLTDAWGRAVRRAGLPHRKPYSLRHTSASLLLSGGINIRTVSARLGHETVEMTLRVYSHLMPGDDDRAAEVLARTLADPKPNGQRAGNGGRRAAPAGAT